MIAARHPWLTREGSRGGNDDDALEMLHLRCDLAAASFLAKGLLLGQMLRRKDYDPNQPRNPAGMGEDSGRWVRPGASGAFRDVGDADDNPYQGMRNGRLFIAIWPSNGGPQLEEPPPVIPPVPLLKRWPAIRLARVVTLWVARVAPALEALAMANPVTAGLLIVGVVAGFWLYDSYGGYITSYFEGPKPLDELQKDVAEGRQGTDVHHIVEQSSVGQKGIRREDVEAPSNKVRISTFKHWEINRYYSRYDRELGMSPRDYLRGKSFEEKRAFGIQVLRDMEILEK